MTLVCPGQLLIGQFDGEGPNRVAAVKSISRLQSGDRKAWLVYWEPHQTDDDHGVVEKAQRFAKGEIAAPWRLLDLYDPAALLDRAEHALRLYSVAQTPQETSLKVLQAMFRGPGA